MVSELRKASGGFGTRWMTDLINNIVKEGYIPDDWRKSILVPVYKGKGDQQGERCKLITCSLASCLESEPLMPFSSCDKYKRNTKQRRRSCT